MHCVGIASLSSGASSSRAVVSCNSVFVCVLVFVCACVPIGEHTLCDCKTNRNVLISQDPWLRCNKLNCKSLGLIAIVRRLLTSVHSPDLLLCDNFSYTKISITRAGVSFVKCASKMINSHTAGPTKNRFHRRRLSSRYLPLHEFNMAWSLLLNAWRLESFPLHSWQNVTNSAMWSPFVAQLARGST